MYKHFINITKKLKLDLTETETNELTLSKILDSYKDNLSIIKIRSHINGEKNLFSLKLLTSEELSKTILLSKKQQRINKLHYSSQNT